MYPCNLFPPAGNLSPEMEIRKAMRIARGRALRISIPGILLVAIVGKGDILRFGRQSLRYVHIRNPK